jgi:glutathione peroxidase
MQTASFLDVLVKDISGSEVSLRTFEGQVLLVVNVASRCGFTPQYAGLQTLYERYRGRGFQVLAFPANDFLRQEPGSDSEIRQFCKTKYSVSFPLFSRISVRGKSIHPLYEYLTGPDTTPKFSGKIRWNFSKFLLDRRGTVVARFEPKTEPMSPEIIDAVESALGS